ncbi:hypothetical protein CLD20_08315 [Afifella sp. IM 167]|nr:hypothetical protein [Thiocystis violacea]MBZ8133265.1 hypothetical protein [Afifella sp. IM 167]
MSLRRLRLQGDLANLRCRADGPPGALEAVLRFCSAALAIYALATLVYAIAFPAEFSEMLGRWW